VQPGPPAAERPESTVAREPWWHAERDRLLALVRDGEPRYVYHLPTTIDRARKLRTTLRSVSRLYYAMKANANAQLLAALASEGCGVECVSAAEVRHARSVLGPDVPMLFTPSFCPIDEYATALDAGAECVIDGAEPVGLAPETFRGRSVGLRVDPGFGRGHHEKVRTAGREAKFGCATTDVAAVREAVARVGGRIGGLHAHVGSGILDPGVWTDTTRALLELVPSFFDLEWLDPGGGLGVPSRPGQSPLDLARIERGLAALRATLGGLALRLEPGRYLVSEAGVLVSPVTQVRTKRGVRFVGLAVGMNALVRPALYGAWHGIHNLSRLDDPPIGPWHVVGPICETADVLGRDRPLPDTHPGDVLLIENVGAYGIVMASSYNLRPPPREVVLE
jgi:bifunctional diaminopimelate decarboxylase / aspartate kinase